MSPPTATTTETETYTPSNGHVKPDDQPEGTVPNESNLKQGGAEIQLQNFPSPPRFTDKYEERTYLKGRLALAFRIFGKLGYDEGVAGHITLRDPVDPTTFWVNPFGVAFSLIKSSDLILVDHDGKVIDGGPCRLLNTAAYMIHSAVHAARPDVICAAHSHSLYGRAYCALGKPLDITTQDSCAFYNDHAVYDSFKGVVLAKEEGENIAKGEFDEFLGVDGC
jgi:ribulose-5-phosphate 4-epimerase/fuculose-1-phosphate aldolase